ncbi:MAG: YbaK/EbsC family protein, partial [Planctomycetes bacterium]|nr:YbaK/EbsC family protein [Planctomycetota bacterium]
MDVQEHFSKRKVPYETLRHGPVTSAADVAATIDAPLHAVAQTRLLKADGGYCYVVAVAPAEREIDFEKAGEALGGSRLEPASPEETAVQCPDTEGGIISPFGSQYHLKVLLDEELSREEYVHFPGATREETIRVKLGDYVQ